MKKIIITLTLAYMATSAAAQKSVAFFQIENENHILIEQAVPNTNYECYTTTQGGKRIDNIKISTQGNALYTADIEHTPAFIIDRKTLSNTNGTDQVVLLNKKEFVAKEIETSVLANQLYISWNACVYDGNNISFQILKQEQNGAMKIVKTIDAQVSNTFSHYTFSEPYNSTTHYTLQILKDKTKLRYTTAKIGAPSSTNQVSVYPTICHEQLYVEVENMNALCSYALYDMTGKMIMKGEFNNIYNVLNLQSLANGNYILNLFQNLQKQSFKITKE